MIEDVERCFSRNASDCKEMSSLNGKEQILIAEISDLISTQITKLVNHPKASSRE